jgi:predicted nuclease of restriction endonuclease-like (RecB) superfamily
MKSKRLTLSMVDVEVLLQTKLLESPLKLQTFQLEDNFNECINHQQQSLGELGDKNWVLGLALKDHVIEKVFFVTLLYTKQQKKHKKKAYSINI